MNSLAVTLLVLAAALLIDRMIGDPPWLWRRVPHPVALVGRAIAALDARFNDPSRAYAARRLRGAAVAIGLVAAGAAAGYAIQRGLAALSFGLGVEALLVAVLLAHKSLIDHVVAVGRALVARGPEGGTEGGRRAVTRIVGRDVSALDEAGVSRAAMESAAENFSDGVVAPAFWYALLGLPGLLAYKAANTADSMIGHRSEQYAAFGWAAARIDDVLSFLPARLSALLVAVAAALCACDARGAVTTALRDAPKHKSPNAGWPEAALAGALGVAFGGPRRYGAVEVKGVWLNPEGRRTVGPADILAAVRLIDAAWAVMIVLLALAAITLIAVSQ